MSLFSGMSADKSADASADALCIIIQDYLGLCGTIWGLSGTIWTIWDCLGPSGTVWDYLGLIQTRLQVGAGESKLLRIGLKDLHVISTSGSTKRSKARFKYHHHFCRARPRVIVTEDQLT